MLAKHLLVLPCHFMSLMGMLFMERLHIISLGKPQILMGSVPLELSNKAQALLYYLAITGRTHQRQTLVNLLWSQKKDGKNNLRVALTHLRKQVGEHLAIDRHSVSFNRANPYWLDVEVLKTTLKSQQPLLEQLQAAIEVYQSPFLEGFEILKAPEFEKWVGAQRQALHNLAIYALQNLILLSEQQNNQVAVIEYKNRLLEIQS